MTFSYPLSLPATPGFNSFTLRRSSVVGVSSSPYSGVQQVYAYPGQWWEADVGFPEMGRTDAALWRAFFGKLNGREGTFLMGDPTASTPDGLIGGSPLKNGAGAIGDKTLVLDGATHGVTGWLKAGDFINTGTGASTRLYMVLTDANSDGSGNVTLDIWPALRYAVADNEAIVVTGAKGLFRLSSNQTQDASRPYPFYSMGFTAVEAI